MPPVHGGDVHGGDKDGLRWRGRMAVSAENGVGGTVSAENGVGGRGGSRLNAVR
jgi:hypothetical protein